MRSAFDHIARAHAVMSGLVSEKELGLSGADVFRYCEKNFDKAHGHLYRAAYDAYDVIAVSYAIKIEELQKNFSSRALFTVIPDASEKIINPYESAKDLVTQEKLQKDVNNKAEEQEQFEQYETATNTLKDVYDTLTTHMPALLRVDKEERKSERKNNLGLAIGIIGTVLGIIGVVLIFWNPFGKSSSANSGPTAIIDEVNTRTSPEHNSTEKVVLPSH